MTADVVHGKVSPIETEERSLDRRGQLLPTLMAFRKASWSSNNWHHNPAIMDQSGLQLGHTFKSHPAAIGLEQRLILSVEGRRDYPRPHCRTVQQETIKAAT